MPTKEERYIKDWERTRERIKKIEKEMEEVLTGARKRLGELLEEKKAMLKIYDGLCALLGKENEFEGMVEEEDEIKAASGKENG
ncbi:MAG: hypothetical protein ACE5LC_00605 [Candidatus Aminicenantales bacterium]